MKQSLFPRKPKESEDDILKTILDYLKILENQRKLVFIRNNTGAIKTTDNRFIRFGRTGSPDVIIFLKDKQTIFLEVKSSVGVLSVAQRIFKNQVEAFGFKYEVIHSFEEVNKLIR